MAKKSGRGWVVYEFAWECYNCCCSVCTGRMCPYTHGWGVYRFRCAKCVQGYFDDHRICLECDFFENKYTVPRHYKVIRHKRPETALEQKVDAIMVKLGVEISSDGKNDGK